MPRMESYSDYGIHDVDPYGATEQRVVCPQCEKRKGVVREKDLAVNISKGTWFCHSANCGWAGGIKEIKEFHRPAFRKIDKPSNPLSDAYIGWFESRGIPKSVVERNRITKDKVWMPDPKTDVPVVCFNYFAGDELINIKYRTTDKHFRQEKDADKIFYKLNDIENEKECIITEGEMDALSFEVAGYKNAVSVPDGGINPNVQNITKKLEYLDNCAEYFINIRKIYLATDSDGPGIRLRDELARRLGKAKCYVVNFNHLSYTNPETDEQKPCKDANEVLVHHGKTALMNCIASAEPYPIEGIHYAEQKTEEVNYLYEHGFPNGAKTGWHDFDELVNFYDSLVCVITGIPSHGKSNFLDHLMIRLAIKNNWRFGIFSPENGKLEIHYHRLIEIIVGKPFLPHYNSQMSREEKDKALAWINKSIYHILPKDEDFTLNNILDAASYLILKHGIKALIIDPWNTIEHQYGKDSETEYTKKVLNQLTYFARNNGILLFIVAHPAKMKKRKDSNKYELPSLYDISGSANWYNKAELGLTVYRDFKEDLSETLQTIVYVQKVKHKFIGRVGYVKFDFEIACQRYYERGSMRDERSYFETELINNSNNSQEDEDGTIPF